MDDSVAVGLGSTAGSTLASEKAPVLEEHISLRRKHKAMNATVCLRGSARTEAQKARDAGVSLYKEEYCAEIRAYFSGVHYEEREIQITMRGGNVMRKLERVPVPPPHLKAFCRQIGVRLETVERWAKDRPETFGYALQDAKDMYEEWLKDGGLLGLYNAQVLKFVAVNDTGMRDRTAVDVTSEHRQTAPTISIRPREVPGKAVELDPGAGSESGLVSPGGG